GRTLSTQLALMDEYKEYKFLLCEPVITESIKKDYPNIYNRIKEKFKEGQIIPEGGMWVEPDTNIPSGESLIRQCTFGRRWFLDEFGVETKLLWLPDCFGFSGQLPQIMKGCKIKYFATQKLARALQGHDKFPYNHFYWEGIDGSKILTHFYKKNNSRFDPYLLNERWMKDRIQDDFIDTFLFPFGYGDGGGGATRDMLESTRRSKDLEGAPRTKMESPIEFFKSLEEKNTVRNRYVGEIYLPWHRGIYTAESYIKKANRKAEYALRDLEIVISFYRIICFETESNYLSKARKLWEILLFNQFHDIIAGTSIRRVHEEAADELTYVIEEAIKIKRSLLDEIFSYEGFGHRGQNGISVMNTLSWSRKELILLPEEIVVPCDFSGNILPVHIGVEGRYCMAEIPSFGLASVRNKEGAEPIIDEGSVRATISTLENAILRIEFDALGQIISIYDKELEIEYAASICNKFRMFKDVNIEYDAWEISPYYEEMEIELEGKAHIEVIEKAGLFATIRISKSLNGSSLTQDITMYSHSRRVDFNTTIDWKETHKLLKVEFPVNVHAEEAYEEIQFGYVKRPTHQSRNYDADRFEVCNHKYTALSESNRTFAVLNDCKYGVSTKENAISLTLLRSPVIPDMYSDKGVHQFTYSIYLDNCNFYESNVIKEGYSLNAPITIINNYMVDRSFFELTNKDIVLETIKLADDHSGDIILRMYESKGGHCLCDMESYFTIQSTYEVSMIETIEEDSELLPVLKKDKNNYDYFKIPLSFRPFEIKTIRIIA
ncbi:MAG: alpha-mannosidase, partial [Anaerolineaceae bacterium]